MNTHAILQFLDVNPAPPSLDLLDALVAAYVRRVPWESASRIARRAANDDINACPNWPESFWAGAMTQGTGGTCYESNLAFFALLRSLGFTGYLTVNNMNESIGCHTAIVITLGDERWLVDVGIPIHVPIPLLTHQVTHRKGPFHTYTITPNADNAYTLTRDRHPKPYIFTLIDQPVPEADYCAITTADYDPDKGLFLDRVIVTRILRTAGHEQIWRFSAETPPFQLESFQAGDVTYHLLGDNIDTAADGIAAQFGIDHAIVIAALQHMTTS